MASIWLCRTRNPSSGAITLETSPYDSHQGHFWQCCRSNSTNIASSQPSSVVLRDPTRRTSDIPQVHLHYLSRIALDVGAPKPGRQSHLGIEWHLPIRGLDVACSQWLSLPCLAGQPARAGHRRTTARTCGRIFSVVHIRTLLMKETIFRVDGRTG